MKIILILIFGLSLFAQDVPDWISKTQDSQYFYGVGSAPQNQNSYRQLRIAKIFARANLSENISILVESNFSKKMQSDKKETSFQSVQTSKHILKYHKVLKKWKNSQGELFILLGIKKRSY